MKEEDGRTWTCEYRLEKHSERVQGTVSLTGHALRLDSNCIECACIVGLKGKDGSCVVLYDPTQDPSDLLCSSSSVKEAEVFFVMAQWAREFVDAGTALCVVGGKELTHSVSANLEAKAILHRGDDGNIRRGSFRITDVKPGLKRIAFKSIGFVSFESVCVESPMCVGSTDDSYVVYALRSHLHFAEESRIVEWIVYHRYSEFEQFHKQLEKKIADRLDSSSIILPDLPAKPWIPIRQTSDEATSTRCKELNAYIQAVIGKRQIVDDPKNPVYLDHVLRFLAEGDYWMNKDGVGPRTSIIEKGVSGLNKALSYFLDNKNTPEPHEDYNYVRDLFTQYGLKSKKVPWNKFVLSVFGSTSAGKSSLVSHLFTVACSASSMAGQVDTGFSIIEAVSEAEFLRHTTVIPGDVPDFSEDDLKESVQPSSQNMQSDRRYGSVFLYLDAAATLERYREQFSSDLSDLEKYNRIRTVLINEKYLCGSEEEVALAKSIIVIDSKGIDASMNRTRNSKPEEDSSMMWSEIKASQFLCKISNLTLFMIPASEIRNSEPSISVFEMTLICSEEGMSFAKKEMKKAQLERSSSSKEDGKSSDPFAGLLYRLMGVDALYGVAKSVGSSVASQWKKYWLPTTDGDIERGTSRWNNTFFVLSRADQALRGEGEGTRQAELQLFYELGLAFGRRLRFLEPPTFSQIRILGLPEKQKGSQEKVTGFLEDFKRFLLKKSAAFSPDRTRDDSIITMCQELERELSGWRTYLNAKYHGNAIQAARRRAESRRVAFPK